MILSFRTDRSEQTAQTQIRLFLEEQSDQGLHYLPFCLHILDPLPCSKTILFQFLDIYNNFFRCIPSFTNTSCALNLDTTRKRV